MIRAWRWWSEGLYRGGKTWVHIAIALALFFSGFGMLLFSDMLLVRAMGGVVLGFLATSITMYG